MTYILGIDGGGSKTFALVADTQGQLHGFGQAGPSNHQGRGLEAAMLSVERAGRDALQSAGVHEDEVTIVSCGLGGADLPEDFAMLQPALERLKLGGRVDLRNDTQVALRAGTHETWGVVLICGTGFNVAGRAPDGREICFPGLGWLSGDWGGAGMLATEMVRLVMREADGRGRPTVLTQMLLEALEQPTPYELMRALYHQHIQRPHLLATVPLLFRAAMQADEPAQELIIRLGEELGLSAATVIRRLGLEEDPVEVVLGGSVFKGEGPLLTDTLIQVIHRVAPRAVLVWPAFEPVVGAVLLGLEAAGVPIDDRVYTGLRTTMPDPLRVVKGTLV